MHPEDRVLVAVMRHPRDLAIAREQGWYRVPEKHAPPGLFSEYLAFYFTAAFGEDRWAIHYYARNLGHELVTRRDLLPGEAAHPRAGERYYKLQVGPLQRRQPPIHSQRWRRITFLHTTWDRFQAAGEINDLFTAEEEFVDRLYHALRDAGLAPERCYPLREGGSDYQVDLAVPCRRGTLVLGCPGSDPSPPGALCVAVEALVADPGGCLDAIRAEVRRRGGLRPLPRRN